MLLVYEALAYRVASYLHSPPVTQHSLPIWIGEKPKRCDLQEQDAAPSITLWESMSMTRQAF